MSAGRYTRGLTIVSRRVDPAELVDWLQTLPEGSEVSVATGTHGDRHEFTAHLPGPEAGLS